MQEKRKMKFTNSDITLVDGKLVINGGQYVEAMFEEAKREPNIRRQAETSAYLPNEDVTPGHVIPAVVLTTSRSC
jgi:hypothetical protein